MTKPLRWGIIGTGGIAHTFVRDLGLIDEGTAVAVGSRTEASANAFADEFDIPTRFGSYEELVSDPDVDVVYVSTPHPMHHANTLLALNAGKPVLCEKPFTMNSSEARDVVAIAREKGLFLMEAMWTRFLPHIVKIRELVQSGALGELVLVEADHGQWFPLDPNHRIFAPELGGGALLDLGVYPVSFASHHGSRRSRLHRGGWSNVHALWLRQRGAGRLDVHVASEDCDESLHRGHGSAHRDCRRLLRFDVVRFD
jgi:predicted dehydrogenase